MPFKNGESQPFLRKFFKFVYKILTVFIKDLLSETLPRPFSAAGAHLVVILCLCSISCYVAFAMV